jgi:hypothetical protein
MPMDLAFASASHAVHSATRPRASRRGRDRLGQPAGPTFMAQAPPSTQTSVATHHTSLGAVTAQPAHRALAQAAASRPPAA